MHLADGMRAIVKLAHAFDVVCDQPCGPQYPQEAREAWARRWHAYRDQRTVLLDECRTARLLMGSSGRRLCPLYRADLQRAQRDMVLARAVFHKGE